MKTIKQLEKILRNAECKLNYGDYTESGFEMSKHLATEPSEFESFTDLPFEVVDHEQACHDGQGGFVVLRFKNDDRLLAFDYTYSSWGDGWLSNELYEVKARQEMTIYYDRVK